MGRRLISSHRSARAGQQVLARVKRSLARQSGYSLEVAGGRLYVTVAQSRPSTRGNPSTRVEVQWTRTTAHKLYQVSMVRHVTPKRDHRLYGLLVDQIEHVAREVEALPLALRERTLRLAEARQLPAVLPEDLGPESYEEMSALDCIRWQRYLQTLPDVFLLRKLMP